MTARFVIYIIVILLGFVLSLWKSHSRSKRIFYVFFIITLLILESSLRSVNVGPDTLSYYFAFIDITNTGWREIWSSFFDSYVLGSGKDPGFLVFMKTVQLFSKNFQFFLFVCALLFFVPLGMIFYRYSDRLIQLVFAFTFYLAIFHIVALSGIRQQIATGFAFIAFLSLGKKQYWKSIVFILIGSVIHISAVLFLAVPFLHLFGGKVLKPLHLGTLILVPFVALTSNSIIFNLASFLPNDYYSGYGAENTVGGAITYIALMSLLSLFCYIAIRKKHLQEDTTVSFFYIMLPLLTLTAPLTSLSGAMIRVGQYFTVYMTLLVPFAIDRIAFGKNKDIIYIVAVITLIALSLRGEGFQYEFFWQASQLL